jgi:hypothetical protein
LGDLIINNPPSHTTINIDDSQDHTSRSVTLGTFTTYGVPWGSVTGLAPAGISYKYVDTSSVHITTNTAAVTMNVLGTGVPTYLSTVYTGTVGGHNTVNVGDGTLKGIKGALYISNQPNYTALTINDSADTADHEAHLDSFTGPDGRSWGSITGLAPAAINFAWSDMYNQTVDVLGYYPSDINWWVNNNAWANVVGVIVFQTSNYSPAEQVN